VGKLASEPTHMELEGSSRASGVSKTNNIGGGNCMPKRFDANFLNNLKPNGNCMYHRL
jgi:hypothetical protein